jgi:hypothetical protein
LTGYRLIDSTCKAKSRAENKCIKASKNAYGAQKEGMIRARRIKMKGKERMIEIGKGKAETSYKEKEINKTSQYLVLGERLHSA